MCDTPGGGWLPHTTPLPWTCADTQPPPAPPASRPNRQDFYASHKTQVEESAPYIEQYGKQRLPKVWGGRAVGGGK